MSEVKQQRRPGRNATHLAAGSALISALLLSGCGSIGDAINPLNWFDGSSDQPAAAAKADGGPAVAPMPALPAGLLADTSNARHVDEAFRRDGTATRSLNADVAVARPVQSVVMTRARTDGAAPAVQAPPAPAPQPVPQAEAAPSSPPPAAEQVAAASPQPAPQPAPPRSGGLSVGGVLLTGGTAEDDGAKVPPAPQAKVRPQAIQPLDADKNAGKAAASFQVGTIAFGEGTADLPAAELQRVKEVADLYRQKGGTLRILGHSSSARIEVNPLKTQEANRHLAKQRAEAVARELVRLGVPARKIYAGAALDVAQAMPAGGGDATEIYIDY